MASTAPSSDGLQPNSNGLQPNFFLLSARNQVDPDWTWEQLEQKACEFQLNQGGPRGWADVVGERRTRCWLRLGTRGLRMSHVVETAKRA